MAVITAIDQTVSIHGELKHVTMTLDTEHREIVRMINKAAAAKGGQSKEAGGALVVKVSS